ncbi:MAG: hypothetical protein IPK16_30535 [Anaerolineales bacterium]|nr:hypothetical protein [Anaerolineales bacterium]
MEPDADGGCTVDQEVAAHAERLINRRDAVGGEERIDHLDHLSRRLDQPPDARLGT